MIKKLIFKIYHEMQHHYWTFRILVWLKECGITRKVSHYITRFPNRNAKKEQKEKMEEARYFYHANRERIVHMLELLSDEKSKKVGGG